MTKSAFRKDQSQGISILSILISLGILGIVVLASMSLAKQYIVESVVHIRNGQKEDIRNHLRNNLSCSNTLAATPSCNKNSFINLYDDNNEVLVSSRSITKFGKWGMRSRCIKTDDRVELTIEAKRTNFKNISGKYGEWEEIFEIPYSCQDNLDELKNKCWFAVSGFYVGGRANNNWKSKFPKTLSGKLISTGEFFDLAGGVYLNARKTPYVYKDGSNTIDKAIDMTFDGFAVAPGMKIEIKDGSGGIVFSGKGPLIVRSNNYGNNPQATTLRNYMKANINIYPQWLQDHLKQINFTAPAIPLHTSRSVMVDVIAGEPCEATME
jgi:hypothetical protein